MNNAGHTCKMFSRSDFSSSVASSENLELTSHRLIECAVDCDVWYFIQSEVVFAVCIEKIEQPFGLLNISNSTTNSVTSCEQLVYDMSCEETIGSGDEDPGSFWHCWVCNGDWIIFCRHEFNEMLEQQCKFEGRIKKELHEQVENKLRRTVRYRKEEHQTVDLTEFIYSRMPLTYHCAKYSHPSLYLFWVILFGTFCAVACAGLITSTTGER